MLCHYDPRVCYNILYIQWFVCFVIMTLILCYHDPGYVTVTYLTVVIAGVMCMTYTIQWLKMVSYVQVNYWCRQKRNKVKKMSESIVHLFPT